MKLKMDEERLSSKKAKADKLSQQVIPEIMESMKMKTMKLRDGSAIEMKEIYSATIPKDKQVAHLTGFERTAMVILLKMRLLFPLVVTKITRRVNTLTLPRVMGFSLNRN